MGKRLATTARRPDPRVGVAVLRASNPEYRDALANASKTLNISLCEMIDLGLGLLLDAHRLPPLPPRKSR